MPHACTEEQLVGQPGIGLFAELGWKAASAMEEVFGANGTLARETPGEAVLVSRLPAALERLNPLLPPEAIAAGKLKAYRRGWIQLHRQVLAIP